MKIGILGGTFNPIHNGHIILGKCAYSQFDLDQILVMPTPNPHYKNVMFSTSLFHRTNMIKEAIKNIPYFKYSDIECRREGRIYTSDTLKIMHKMSDDELYFILGADSLFSIESWHCPEDVLSNAIILAAMRDTHDNIAVTRQINYLKDKYDSDIRLLRIPKSDVSSSQIRDMVLEGINVSDYIPSEVYKYIMENNIYGKKEY